MIRAEAEADLADARSWYEQRENGLGDKFLERVEESLEQIDRLPESHRIVYRSIRRAQVRRFPFLVYYSIVAGGVVVLGIVHSHRDPKVWQSRA